MFIRENKNRSGSVSVQVIIKINGRNKILKTVGCGTQCHEIDRLRELARQEIDRLQSQPRLFNSGDRVEIIFMFFNKIWQYYFLNRGKEVVIE